MTVSELPSMHTLRELVSNPRRRAIIEVCGNHDGTHLTLRYLTKQVGARQEDIHPEQVTGKVYKRYRVSLMKDHLPLLVEHNIIQYNSDRQRITAGNALPMTYQFLQLSRTAYQWAVDRES